MSATPFLTRHAGGDGREMTRRGAVHLTLLHYRKQLKERTVCPGGTARVKFECLAPVPTA